MDAGRTTSPSDAISDASQHVDVEEDVLEEDVERLEADPIETGEESIPSPQ
jgi:hypothetical protein